MSKYLVEVNQTTKTLIAVTADTSKEATECALKCWGGQGIAIQGDVNIGDIKELEGNHGA